MVYTFALAKETQKRLVAHRRELMNVGENNGIAVATIDPAIPTSVDRDAHGSTTAVCYVSPSLPIKLSVEPATCT